MFICACMYVVCLDGIQRLHEGGHCFSEGDVMCCDEGPADESSREARAGSGPSGFTAACARRCEDVQGEVESEEGMSIVSDEEEEDEGTWPEGDWFCWESVTSG